MPKKTAPNPTRQARSWRVVTVVSLLLKDIKVQSLHWLTSVSTNINLQGTSLRQLCCPRLSCIASPTSFCFSLFRSFPWANDLFGELIGRLHIQLTKQARSGSRCRQRGSSAPTNRLTFGMVGWVRK